MQTYFTRKPDTEARFQCRHILTDGHRCSAPCLRHEEFCYYHHTTRRPIENPAQRKSRLGTFDMPMPEDRSAIQLAIGEILQRIASNDLDPRRAGLLLYGLQIASLNLPKPLTADRTPTDTTYLIVEETTEHPTHGTLAPIAEVGSLEPKDSISQLLDDFRDSDKENIQREREDLTCQRTELEQLRQELETQRAELQQQEAEPTTIPTIQATAQPHQNSFILSEPRACRGCSRRACPELVEATTKVLTSPIQIGAFQLRTRFLYPLSSTLCSHNARY